MSNRRETSQLSGIAHPQFLQRCPEVTPPAASHRVGGTRQSHPRTLRANQIPLVSSLLPTTPLYAARHGRVVPVHPIVFQRGLLQVQPLAFPCRDRRSLEENG